MRRSYSWNHAIKLKFNPREGVSYYVGLERECSMQSQWIMFLEIISTLALGGFGGHQQELKRLKRTVKRLPGSLFLRCDSVGLCILCSRCILGPSWSRLARPLHLESTPGLSWDLSRVCWPWMRHSSQCCLLNLKSSCLKIFVSKCVLVTIIS